MRARWGILQSLTLLFVFDFAITLTLLSFAGHFYKIFGEEISEYTLQTGVIDILVVTFVRILCLVFFYSIFEKKSHYFSLILSIICTALLIVKCFFVAQVKSVNESSEFVVIILSILLMWIEFGIIFTKLRLNSAASEIKFTSKVADKFTKTNSEPFDIEDQIVTQVYKRRSPPIDTVPLLAKTKEGKVVFAESLSASEIDSPKSLNLSNTNKEDSINSHPLHITHSHFSNSKRSNSGSQSLSKEVIKSPVSSIGPDVLSTSTIKDDQITILVAASFKNVYMNADTAETEDIVRPAQRSISVKKLYARIKDEKTGIKVSDHEISKKIYPATFSGADAVDWMMERLQMYSREDASGLGKYLVDENYLKTANTNAFIDNPNSLFRFKEDHERLYALKQLVIIREEPQPTEKKQTMPDKAKRQEAIMQGLEKGLGWS